MQCFKYFFIFGFLFFLSLCYPQNVLYDFGSMQQGKSFSVEPGEQLNLSLFFFVDKEYGNRITHISLEISEKPENWDISIIPQKHKEMVNVSGILVESEENIYVEPREVLSQKPESIEEGISYLLSPSGKGYLQAKEVKIIVKVPKNAELGKVYPLKINAEAFWFGSEANIALKQTRSFRFEIKTIKKEFSEEIVKQKQENQTTTSRESQLPLFEFNSNILILLGAGLIFLLLIWWFFIKKKKKSKIQKSTKKTKKR